MCESIYFADKITYGVPAHGGLIGASKSANFSKARRNETRYSR